MSRVDFGTGSGYVPPNKKVKSASPAAATPFTVAPADPAPAAVVAPTTAPVHLNTVTATAPLVEPSLAAYALAGQIAQALATPVKFKDYASSEGSLLLALLLGDGALFTEGNSAGRVDLQSVSTLTMPKSDPRLLAPVSGPALMHYPERLFPDFREAFRPEHATFERMSHAVKEAREWNIPEDVAFALAVSAYVASIPLKQTPASKAQLPINSIRESFSQLWEETKTAPVGAKLASLIEVTGAREGDYSAVAKAFSRVGQAVGHAQIGGKFFELNSAGVVERIAQELSTLQIRSSV